MNNIDVKNVIDYLKNLQTKVCEGFGTYETKKKFISDNWSLENGTGISRILENGQIFEKVGVNFSHVTGSKLPISATKENLNIANKPFRAMGVSVVSHPKNPFAPTSHMNVRFFMSDDESTWWFGGGFDLTPYYGFLDDAVHWHQTAKDACSPFGEDVYPTFKKACDEYFFLKHRNEQRGIGGLFFDDYNSGGFDHAFSLTRSVGDHFLPAYLPIIERRHSTNFTEKERDFQLYRRGRYVEFNLVCDRGTLFGLQSGGRTESILVSLPPKVCWRYDWQPDFGSPEDQLTKIFLSPRDWLDKKPVN